MATLTIDNAVKRYGAVEVLKGVSIDLKDGEFLVLLGASGCGKSTLLNMIAGLESVTEGEISIGGRVVNDVHPKDRDIAMVFQSYALYPTMTVADNMAFGLRMRGQDKAERSRAVEEVAKLLQIDHLLDRKPGQLSGGQRQRVAMGRALVRRPEVFLFDEPLSNLDAKLRIELRSEIKRLHQRLGTTMVYVTHDQIEALTLADRIAILRDGTVQQLGTPDEIYRAPKNMFVAGFVGAPPINFVPAEVVSHDGGLAARFHAVRGDDSHDAILPLHRSDLEVGRKVMLGIRPEDLSVVAEGGIECTAQLIEPTGADTMCMVDWAGVHVVARLAPAEAPKMGDHLRLGVVDEHVLLFDPETEEAL